VSSTKLDFESARRAVARHARVTPLLPVQDLSERLGRPVYVKAECLQHTGSFKVRGAAARLEVLTAAERAAGVVACSSGNHGRAVAFVAQRMDIRATVYVPEWVDRVKLEGIRAAGADARLAGATFDESEAAAVADAETSGRTYVSAYDDPWVIAGQGTLAFEIAEALDEFPAAVIAPLSGGGLLGGVAAAFGEASSASVGGSAGPAVGATVGDTVGATSGGRVSCVAVSASNAAVMLASIRAGTPVEVPEEDTLANALAGGIGLDNRHSFGLVRDLVAEHAEVSERQIAEAMRYAVGRLHLVAEGGGAVGLAAVLSGVWQPAPDLPKGPIVVVLTGGNVATGTLVEVLAG
jgi:threonine dehydratase